MHQKKEVMILLMKKNILNLIFSPTKIQYYRQTMQLIFLYNVSVEKYSKFHLLTHKTGQQKTANSATNVPIAAPVDA